MNTAEKKHIEFQTEAEYAWAKLMLEANESAALAWRNAHKTNGIPNEIAETFPFAESVNNELRSAIEEWEFMNNEPEKYFLYINEKNHEATTWTGQKLGDVFFGREYRSNMNDKRVPITISALNGVNYHGTYYKSAGSYARITKSK